MTSVVRDASGTLLADLPPLELSIGIFGYGLDPFSFSLYVHLRHWADQNGEVCEPVANMAAWSQMSVRKVQYALKELEALSLIERQPRSGYENVVRLLEVNPDGL